MNFAYAGSQVVMGFAEESGSRRKFDQGYRR